MGSERMIPGDGPAQALIMLVADRPGQDEDKFGRAFTGRGYEVLWQMALREAGLQRHQVFVTYLVRDHRKKADKHGVWTTKDAAPEQWEIERDAPQLMQELERVQPRLVIPLGKHSVRWFLGDDVELWWANGLRFADHGDPYDVIPVVHPAAGLGKPALLAQAALGLQSVRKWKRGELEYAPDDAYLRPYYVEGCAMEMGPLVAIDTEGSAEEPWSLQWSDAPGSAYLIRAGEEVPLGLFRMMLEARRPRIALHHALADLRVLRALGIDIIGMGLEIVDTMVLAAQDKRLPQGLKALARRFAGMKMTSYEDTVRPAEDRKWQTWIQEVVTAGEVLTQLFTKKGRPSMSKGKPRFKRTSKWGKSVDLKLRNMLLESRAEEPKPVKDRYRAMVKETGFKAPAPEPRLTMDDVPGFLEYACRDADATLRILPILEHPDRKVAHTQAADLDQRALVVLDAMQETGLPVDLRVVKQLRAYYQERMEDLQGAIRLLTDDPEFNPASSDQVAELLFHRLNLPEEKRTKSKLRASTDDTVLKTLMAKYPDVVVLQLIGEFREFGKLDGTYASGLEEFSKADGKSGRATVFPAIRNTVVPSGRLSAYDPNVLAFPTRTSEGRKIRDCIVAPDGWRLGSWDYSQIEMRFAAEEARDEFLLQAFLDGADIHRRLAGKIFGVPEEQVDKRKQREPVKTASYLILYGGSEMKLMEELFAMGLSGWGLEECKELISDWYRMCAGVERYVHEVAAEIRSCGYVTDRWGRSWHLPAAYLSGGGWPFAKLRQEAERQGRNFKFQGGAAGLLERAELRMYHEVIPQVRECGYEIRPLLQVHDELLTLHQEEAWPIVDALMVEAMTADQHMFTVPILTEGKQAQSWGALK